MPEKSLWEWGIPQPASWTPERRKRWFGVHVPSSGRLWTSARMACSVSLSASLYKDPLIPLTWKVLVIQKRLAIILWDSSLRINAEGYFSVYICIKNGLDFCENGEVLFFFNWTTITQTLDVIHKINVQRLWKLDRRQTSERCLGQKGGKWPGWSFVLPHTSQTWSWKNQEPRNANRHRYFFFLKGQQKHVLSSQGTWKEAT